MQEESPHSARFPERLYADHLSTVGERWASALAAAGFDTAIVAAGEPRSYFLDDQHPPFRLNPHFMQWFPSGTAEGSALLIRPGHPPSLYFLRPDDFWHAPPDVPDWAGDFDVRTFSDGDSLLAAVRQDALSAGNHVALVGESDREVLADVTDRNPDSLLNRLHFDRATKTPFELACMRQATATAVRGHCAARDAFRAGASEFDINLAYLAGTEQLPADLPYSNIVALNAHAGVLHYQHYDRTAPAERLSFLIDAGGSHLGYAADITRTYAGDEGSLFAELIGRLDAAQQAVVADVQPSVPFLELHIGMHRRLAAILSETGIVRDSPEAAFEAGVTEAFLPHGLGHLIGLQTHDVGGQQRDVEGNLSPPPANYPSLRLTRTLGEAMPVTIEPGLYFVPQLLETLRQGPNGRMLDWSKIDELRPCGGIRIEDNVAIVDGRVENFTRDAFARIDGR